MEGFRCSSHGGDAWTGCARESRQAVVRRQTCNNITCTLLLAFNLVIDHLGLIKEGENGLKTSISDNALLRLICILHYTWLLLVRCICST